MRYPRITITIVGLALTGASAFLENGAGADPAPVPAAATAPTPAPAVAPAHAPAPRPATLVGVPAGESDNHQQIFEVEIAGGDRWEVAQVDSDGFIFDVERGPDGTVFYGIGYGDSYTIDRLAPTEQGHVEVATGWAPAVSPDGRSLAFAYHPIEIGDVQGPSEDGFCAENGIAVLDLDSGDVRRFPFRSAPVAGTECPASPGRIDSIAWAPDSRRLAYEYVRSMDVFAAGSIRLLDTAAAQTLEDSLVLDGSRSYMTPAWLADGRLALTERTADGILVMAVDVDTRAASPFSPVRWSAGGVNGLDADASGQHLLLSLDGVAHTPQLYALTAGDHPTPLEAGFAIAAW